MFVHGHPTTLIIWRKVAPLLTKKYTVILPDLRGDGDTDKPESTPDHRPYSKKENAKTSSLKCGYEIGQPMLSSAMIAVLGWDIAWL